MNYNSIKAWHKLKDSDYLTNSRRNVYRWVCFNGPATQREADNAINSSAHKRFSELVRQEFLVKIKDVICPVTGKVVGLYEADLYASPVALPREEQLTRAQLIKLLNDCHSCDYPNW